MTFLLRGARVVDLDRGGSPPADVRIRDGVIVEVGPDLEAAGERILDGRGGWLIPGLWDKHLHFGQLVRSSTWLDVAGLPGPEAVAARVAVAPPAAGPLIGFGYRSAGWARTGTVVELDAVTGDRVTVLISGDAHNGWLNSAALRAFGLAPRSGPLEEDDWFPIMGRLGSLPGSQPAPAAEAATAATLASRGVTGIVDFEFTDAHLDWPRRIAAGLKTLRVRTAVYPHQLDDVLAAGLRTGAPLPGGDGLATMGPLKVISDGSMSTRTAWCCEPYLGDGRHGAPNLTAAELTALLRRSADGGLAVAVHAIGDRANAAALDAFATTGAWAASNTPSSCAARTSPASPRWAGGQHAAGPPARRPHHGRNPVGRPDRPPVPRRFPARQRCRRGAGVGCAGGPRRPVARHRCRRPPRRPGWVRAHPRRVADPAAGAARLRRRRPHHRGGRGRPGPPGRRPPGRRPERRAGCPAA
nr:amidohydrolase family protein [Tessaracoccus defluvii]